MIFRGALILSAIFLSGVPFRALAAGPAMACRGVWRQDPSDLKIFVSSREEKIAFKRSGPAEAETVVIFLNGIDKSMKQWNQVRQHLSSERPEWGFVQVDLLGQGRTSELTPRKGPAIPYQEQVRLLNELIQSQGLPGKKLVLVGHSYGGGIAARFAHDHPGLISNAVLIAPFVDHLETYQPLIGPVMWWSKMWADATGTRSWYEAHVTASAELGMAMTWQAYSYLNAAEGQVTDLMSLTRGIRDLSMNGCVSEPGTTRISLVTAVGDALIPTAAHEVLWTHVPPANRGVRLHLASTHEAVSWTPASVTNAILRAVP